ncbi:MAG TPA: LD-carboxypeptidase [Allosphingosinicella sp.]
MRIGVVATGGPLSRALVEPLRALAEAVDPAIDISFHDQCFESHGHFAGTDRVREDAFVQYANDPGLDSIWFGRGGYGTCRIAEAVLARLGPAAAAKTYLGYSDAGYLLAGLYRRGIGTVAHGPMPGDLRRGPEPVERALRWLARREPDCLEPSLSAGGKAAAFNMIVFSQLLGTALEPDLTGHVLMLEEVEEHMYRIDRTMFHISGNANVRRVAGIRLGRCAPIPPNDPDFGQSEEEVMRYWCDRAGIAWLGGADIGHDDGNRVVPFGSI